MSVCIANVPYTQTISIRDAGDKLKKNRRRALGEQRSTQQARRFLARMQQLRRGSWTLLPLFNTQGRRRNPPSCLSTLPLGPGTGPSGAVHVQRHGITGEGVLWKVMLERDETWDTSTVSFLCVVP
jgi:hypothetical protein